MTWTELVDRVADTAGTSKAEARRVLSAFADTCVDRLADGDVVRIPRVGSLSTADRRPRVIRDIASGRRMRLGASTRVRFRPAAELKRAVVDPSAQWRQPEHQAAWRLSEALVGDLELYHAARAPQSVDGSDHEVRAACSAAFGPLWDRVVASYDLDVPSEVRRNHDYLAGAARSRWA